MTARPGPLDETAHQPLYETAYEAVLGRVVVTRDEVGARFPLSADPGTGAWKTTRRGSWTGGFWAGLLWLRARHTGEPADRAAAEACTARLAEWAGADTATRGLILWYGTALAPESTAATTLRAHAARTCLTALDPQLGLVPWGSAFGGPRLLARADAVPGLVPLLASAGPQGRDAAASHLHRHLDLCVGAQSRLAPAWEHTSTSGWRPLAEPAPGWSRGRAWLLLAVADASVRRDGAVADPDHLRAVAARLGAPLPGGRPEAGAAPSGDDVTSSPLVPPADEDHPDGPLDTSAAAITAVALLKLALLPGAEACARRAEAIVHRLIGKHLSGAETDTSTGTTRPPGMLLDGCHDAPTQTAVRHELIWGDFYLALALAALTGKADLRDV
ncbi:sugar ABC transporter permease [Streptomyces lasiicapitis]|uniref:sugar ABC transporter permease n=1 Tax=Streptomyces lasiicapitis TaxID=1923961 RepID=UPI00364D0AD6